MYSRLVQTGKLVTKQKNWSTGLELNGRPSLQITPKFNSNANIQQRSFGISRERKILRSKLFPVHPAPVPPPPDFLKNHTPDAPYPALGLRRSPPIVTTKPLGIDRGGCGMLSLNAQATGNTLSFEMLTQLNDLIRKYGSRDGQSYSFFIKTANTFFSCGSDLKYMLEHPDKIEEFVYKELQMNYSLLTTKVPAISLIHGLASAGGAALAFNSTFCVSTPYAIYQSPEVSFGWAPFGLIYTLSRLPNHLGRFFGLAQPILKKEDIVFSGLGNMWNTSHNFEVFQTMFGEDVTSLDPDELTRGLAIHHERLEARFKYEEDVEAMDVCFNRGNIPDLIDALTDYQNPRGFFTQDAADKIRAASPLATAVTLRLFQYADIVSMEELFLLCYRAAVRLAKTHDFAEGMKARLFENRKPNWKYKSAKEISESQLDSFFKPLPKEPKFLPTDPMQTQKILRQTWMPFLSHIQTQTIRHVLDDLEQPLPHENLMEDISFDEQDRSIPWEKEWDLAREGYQELHDSIKLDDIESIESTITHLYGDFSLTKSPENQSAPANQSPSANQSPLENQSQDPQNK